MKKMQKDAMELTKSSIFLGIGSNVITASGGSAASLAPFGRYMPTMGRLSAFGGVMRGLKKLKP